MAGTWVIVVPFVDSSAVLVFAKLYGPTGRRYYGGLSVYRQITDDQIKDLFMQGGNFPIAVGETIVVEREHKTKTKK